MSSLVDIVRSRFEEAIDSVQPTAGRWKILVVDDYTEKLMGATLKQYDILKKNVTSIENISRNRAEQAQEAMYILMPTTQNVDRIIGDFSNGKKRYAGAHLFFIDALPDDLARRIVQSPADEHMKTLRDLFLNFWPTEARVFTIQNSGTFFNMFSPPSSPQVARTAKARLEEELRLLAKSIFDLCVTLGEYPYVRFYVPSHHPPLGPLLPPPVPKAVEQQVPSRWRTNLARGPEFREQEQLENNFLCKLLAFVVQQELDDFKKQNQDFGKSTDGRPRGTLLITDRSMDTIAPFVHEFTYQAMCNDLLPIRDGTKYTYKFQSSLGEFEDKPAVLSDADTVWLDVRHMHMREAIDKLMEDFNKFLQENAGFKGGEGAVTLNDMKDMLASLPQYQEMREKFSLHLNMAQECMNIFEKQNLPSLAQIEQNCATGMTSDGKYPKTLVEEMVPLLDSKDISNAAKARIIALYVQFRDGVPEEDKRRLFQHARLPITDQDAVNGLQHMGARLTRASGDRDTKRKIKPKKASTDEQYELSRFSPLLHTVLEEHCAGKLDATVFPYVKDTPVTGTGTSLRNATASPQPATSLRNPKAKATWHKPATPLGRVRASEVRQRLIVFVAGGMTYSEMRTAYQLSEALKQDIYIGSTHTLTPQHFLEDLRVLDLGGVGSRALPKGLSISGPEHPRDFQQLYDQRYLSKVEKEIPDPPRPSRTPAPLTVPQKTSSNKLARPGYSPSKSTASESSLRGSMAGMSLGGSSSADEKKKDRERNQDKKKHFFRFS